MKKVKLVEICKLVGGGTPSKANTDFYLGDIPWATVRDLHGRWLEATEHQISQQAIKGSSTNVIPAGNVVLASRVGLGKVVQLRQDTAINQDLRALIPKENSKIDSNYLYYWTLSITPEIVAAGKGATVQGVTLPFLENLEIPLPSLEKQRDIVEKLDRSFADLELLIQNSSLQISNETELFNQEIDRLLEPVQKGWTSKKLSDWCDFIGTGPFGSAVHKADYVKDGIPLVNPSNIGDGLIIHENIKGVSNKKAQELSSYKLNSGDVVLGRRGEMGRCAIVSKTEENWICGTGSFFLRPKKECHAELLVRILRSERVRAHLGRISTGVTMSNLNNKAVGAIPISLPEKSVQESVLFKINELESAISLLKLNTQRKVDVLGEFQNSLLESVFRIAA